MMMVEEKMRSVCEKISTDSSFLDIVFSWSIDDIFNADLYSEKVKSIPESFETVPEYFCSFMYPLLEETRADLCSSLEIISRAPFAEIVSYDEVKPNGSLMFDVKVDGWRNMFNDRGKEPYKTLPGDIFAVVKSRPDTVHDLHNVARTWVLASVTKISNSESGDEIDEESSTTSFRLKASKDIGEVDGSHSSLFVVFLMNRTTNKRIWNALHMHVNKEIIQGVLQRNVTDEPDHIPCCSLDNNGLPENLLIEISSRLNPSQSEAVIASLQATQCNHKSQVQLVWGPPGTGKTKTISTLLHSLLKMKVRTLTCAPTNVAITEVATRVLDLATNSSTEDCFLGNILLFGNKQRLRVSSDVEDIYLDYRIKRLAECFAPMTGWRSCFPCLSVFLENCVSEYSVFVENELIKAREQGTDGGDNAIQTETFLNFLKRRFKAAVEPVRRCISVLSTHMPRSFMGESNVKNMKFLRDLLDSFEDLLYQGDADSAELLTFFSSSEDQDSHIDTLPLIEAKRRTCVRDLRTLHRSLGDLDLPKYISKHTLSELCFQMASLIFCTASSSSMLFFMPVESPSVLLIDEAAQLKECESAIPLQLPGIRHAILFGDECQLPAMVQSNISRQAGFGRSLFQRLSMLSWPKHLLNVQYRMHPAISAFPNMKFYFNHILDAPSVKSKSYARQFLAGPMYGPYSFINISEGRDELDDDGRSRRNLVEAAVVAKILQNLYKSWRHSTQRLSIGVVSPYAAQVVAIEDMLGRRYENLNNFGVKVKSIDGFQGGEEDVILLSTVRSNKAGQVGFISDAQRTNVALTRARHCLWILGNERTLSRSNSIWETLVCNAKERSCLFNADEDKTLAEAMIEIKKELNQLDDLLNKDSIVFKSARWKVLFSDNFVKSFSKLPSNRTKKSVMNLLVKLSNGWRPKKIKVDPVCDSSLQVVKQYKVEGRYVICTNDIVKESRYIQVMKVWDIVHLEDVSKLVTRLDSVYGAFTDDFLNRCREKSLEGELVVPMTWSTSLDIFRYKVNSAESDGDDVDQGSVSYVENAKVSESLLLMKFYSLSAGIVGHLLSDSDGRALDLPFEVTDQEMQIILQCKSSFILGRSGTGKTTVLTMKLFQKEQLHHLAQEGLSNGSTTNVIHSEETQESGTVLRQLFVTVSPKLCYAIKQHVSHLKSFARGESSTASPLVDADDIDDGDHFKGIPDSFVDISPKSYPLVITFSKFLLMLDGTLGTSYFQRFRDEIDSPCGGGTSLRSANLLMKRREVNYDKFSMLYWPHFNSQHTKKLDASRVFTEIISSIKGGVQVGETDDGKLCMDVYLQLSQGRTSNLSRQKREAIYHIFQDYEKMKAERREFDLADLVNDLHRRLKNEKYGGDMIDFVYIDEVQDLTMRQIALFQYVCRNVEEGFVFAGDTAQTIASGVDFRFQDVRYLFYKEFLLNETSGRSHEKGHLSPISQLSENFRTHAGVLKLGQSVIELIYHFFPHSIDILRPETSLIFGEAPILLESGSDENAIVTIFGNTGNVDCDLVGFGAEQVILVRNDSVRKEISEFVGKNALVLTIVECKGLEFQDVLLYNFFGSSPLKNQWRVLYQYMDVKNLLDLTLHGSFPEFNIAKHNVLCSELKQLYVAITRTRQRLWICENKEDLSKPMFDYWKKLCVVQVRKLDDSLARAMQVASSPEEWKARGKKLLAVENYEVATMCFERAGDRHWEILAKGAGLKASACRMLELNPEESSNILRQAAELFESINEYRRAADCYKDLKDYEKAGKMYFQHCGDSYLELAGECFTLAGCYENAATVYAKGNLFTECLSSCTKGKLFEMGLQYIRYWKHQGTVKDLDLIEQGFLENCALSLYHQHDKKAMMKFVKAFNSEESMRTFLKNSGCLDELLILEEELGNFSKAADIARERGELLLEADLLCKGGHFEKACACYLWLAFASCLWADSRQGWPMKHFQKEEELLIKAKDSAHSSGQHILYKNVCTDVLIFLDRNYSLSQLQEFLILSKDLNNFRGEILSTRRILDTILKTNISKYELDTGLISNSATYSLRMASQNMVSVETLFYFWNSWKATILTILKYLDAVEPDGPLSFGEIGEFCFNYLGIWQRSSDVSSNYVCLFPNAEYLKEIDKKAIQISGKLFSIETHQLLTAARNHWSNELICTGMKVLGVLEEFQKSAGSLLTSSSKIRIILTVFEVAQLLSSLKSCKQRYRESTLLQKYIDFSAAEYFGSVFPLDWRNVVNGDVICLRELYISSQIIEEVILKNFPVKGKLTFGQLGRTAMGLLGSHKCKGELFETVISSLDIDSPWRPLFEVLFGYTRSNALNRTTCNHVPVAETLPEFSLACKLIAVVSDAYDANWRRERDFISPYCFLYLVDRLMVSLLEFQGYVLITRSSLVEWFIHLEWKPSLTSTFSTGSRQFLRDTYSYLAGVLHNLLMNTHDTVEWVKRVGIVAKDNFPVLLLRLVVLMCLIHLNSSMHQDKLRDVLNMRDVTRQLPSPFCNVLWRMQKIGIVNAVAKALNSIEDPLVIVRTGKGPSNLSCEDAIVLDLNNQDRDGLMKVLFPDMACQGRVNAVTSGPSSLGGTSYPADLDNQGTGSLSLVEQEQDPQLQKNRMYSALQNGCVWELFDTLRLVENEDDRFRQSLVSKAAKFKLQIDNLYDLLRTAKDRPLEFDASADDYSNVLAESDCLLFELRLLSAAVGASGKQLKDSMLLIRDSARKVVAGMHVFEYFLGPLIPPKDITSVKKPESDILEADNVEADNEGNSEEGRMDDASAVADGNKEGREKDKAKPNKKQKKQKKKKKNK